MMEKTRFPGVFKRGSRYVAVIGFKDPAGRRRQQWISRATVTEARDAKRELEVEIGKGLRPAAAKATLEAFLGEWLDGVGKGVGRPRQEPLRPLTLTRYASVVRREILPTLGHVRLKDLTPEVIESWSVGRPFAFTVLSSALTWGVRRKRLQANPCRAVERPQWPDKRAPKVLDAGERQRLLGGRQGTPARARCGPGARGGPSDR